MYVDAIDANIIRLLQSNGRATLEELSQATGRSSSQCQRRQKRLESVGIIKRYVALVAPDAVGYPVQVFTLVSVERDEADTFDRFEEAIRAEPTIIHAAIVAGTARPAVWRGGSMSPGSQWRSVVAVDRVDGLDGALLLAGAVGSLFPSA